MKRRDFLKSSGAAVSIPFLLNGMRLSALPRSPLFDAIDPASDRVLVLIQKNGGNDGLNMVFPIDQYDRLANVRANLLLPKNKILALKDTLGLHPSMSGLRTLYEEEKLAVVQSVGYPNQNRSHFRSTDIWLSSSPANEYWNTGWLGRYLETQAPGYPTGYPNESSPDPFAITMGSTVSETCQGTASNFSLTLSDPFALIKLTEGNGGETPDTPYGDELAFLRTSIAQSNAYGDSISSAAKKGKNLATYPTGNRLADQLKNIALMISGGLKTKIYIANIGGFDTHATQVDSADKTQGVHANLLGQLSEAISAFQKDLKMLGQEQRVVGITFSEFGRQIGSNASVGTDHGTAAPLFVFGSCIQTQILGNNPQIPEKLAPQEGVAMQIDFRDIYASILKDWFHVPESDIKTLINPNFTYLPILKDCDLATPTREAYLNDLVDLKLYPNPFASEATLRFSSPGGRIRISLFDAIGSELEVLADQNFASGAHELAIDGQRLASGNYYVRVQGRQFVKTGILIKR